MERDPLDTGRQLDLNPAQNTSVSSSRKPGTGGPAIQRPSAVSAVEYPNSLLSNGLHRRLKMRFSAVAAPSCAASAPRILFRRSGHAGFRDLVPRPD